MEQENKPLFPKHLDHLNITYLEELGFKLWVTKGTRFKASSRLMTADDLSSKSISYLTAYLIIFGLIGVYQSTTEPFIEPKYINFGSTVGSILILIFSLLENAKSYKLEAHKFHSCALEISELHDKIRMRKTLKTLDEESKLIFCEQIDRAYVSLLNKYPNHIDLDYEMFRITKSDYFGLDGKYCKKWERLYFIKVKLLYYILMWLPPCLFIIYFFLKIIMDFLEKHDYKNIGITIFFK